MYGTDEQIKPVIVIHKRKGVKGGVRNQPWWCPSDLSVLGASGGNVRRPISSPPHRSASHSGALPPGPLPTESVAACQSRQIPRLVHPGPRSGLYQTPRVSQDEVTRFGHQAWRSCRAPIGHELAHRSGLPCWGRVTQNDPPAPVPCVNQAREQCIIFLFICALADHGRSPRKAMTIESGRMPVSWDAWVQRPRVRHAE